MGLHFEDRPKVNQSLGRKIFSAMDFLEIPINFLLYFLTTIILYRIFPISSLSDNKLLIAVWAVTILILGPLLVVSLLHEWPRMLFFKKYLVTAKHTLLRVANGKVLEVSNDFLWQADLKNGDTFHDVDVYYYTDGNWFGHNGLYLSGTLKSAEGEFVAKVYFDVNGTNVDEATLPLISWQQLYDSVVKEAGCDSVFDFVGKRVKEQIALHEPEYAPMIAAYLTDQLNAAELLRRLAKNIATWQICPDIPIPFSIEILSKIRIEKPDSGVPVELDETETQVTISIKNEEE